MPFFDERRYKKGSETRVDIMIILQSTHSSTNRHKSGHGTRFHQLYCHNISFLIRAQDIEVVEEI